MTKRRLPVTVVVPTVGRGTLGACLASIARCDPGPDEVLVVDQSGRPDVHRVVVHQCSSARLVELTARSKPRALNVALSEARNDVVLITDDDCTVDERWIDVGYSEAERDPQAMVTGRVLAEGEPSAVTSTIEETEPREYTGELHYGALYGGNMVCRRAELLAFGGFDERFRAAEDNDLCYRWLRAGRRLRYEPGLIVWHHAWRSPREMREVYFEYGRGQGMFYAKHLRLRDPRVGGFLVRDLYRGLRGVIAVSLRGRTTWPDPRIGLLRGLLVGLLVGLGNGRRAASRQSASEYR